MTLETGRISSLLGDEGRRCKATLKSFTASVIQELDLSAADVQALRRSDDAKADRNVYFYFPFCFVEVFPSVPVDQVRDVALSGILWMSYMRSQDDAIDRSATAFPTSLFLRDLYLRRSLHVLYGRFPPASPFWEHFDTFFGQYARAVVLEKRLASPDAPYTTDEYEAIAKGKAAMAKCTVAALAVLSGDGAALPVLCEAIDCFHVAYQYWDDLKDWKEDLASSNPSYLLARARARLDRQQRSAVGPDLECELGRAIHYAGLADDQLAGSFRWGQKAYELALQAGCRIWATHVQRLQMQTSVLRSDLRSIAHENVLRATFDGRGATLSVQTGPAAPAAPGTERERPLWTGASDLGEAIRRGVAYVVDKQGSDGAWRDFMHGGTVATDWATGYVGMMIRGCRGSEEAIAWAGERLLSRQQPNGGWGWNVDITPVDADSTACAILLLEGHGSRAATKAIGSASRRLQGFRHRTGGYATYNDDAALRSFLEGYHPEGASRDGWCSPQVCVTALALQAQLAVGALRDDDKLSSLRFLRSRQEKTGSWQAYWWDDAFYSTYHCLQVIASEADSADCESVQKTVSWFLDGQNGDGSWGSLDRPSNRAFNTALAVLALLLSHPEGFLAEAVQRGIIWLMQHQLADGSWCAAPLLRIPAADVVEPWTSASWAESPGEPNVLIRDQNALFTTSTVLSALNTFYGLAGNVILSMAPREAAHPAPPAREVGTAVGSCRPRGMERP
jgi:hypothetical protein